MGYSSVDNILENITTNGKILEWHWFKSHTTTLESAGVWHRTWTDIGSPGAGIEPATTPGTAFDNEAGSIYWADKSPDEKYLLTHGAIATQDCVVMYYDRLVGVSGVSIATTGAKTINSVALPRYAGADATDVEVWLEVTTAVTAGTPQISMSSYTNQVGTSGRTGATLTLSATPAIHSMWKMPLQSGSTDSGVRSVENLNVSVLGTAGIVNVVLIKPLAYIVVMANEMNERDDVNQLKCLPRIFDGASIGMAFLATTTTAPNFYGALRVGYVA